MEIAREILDGFRDGDSDSFKKIYELTKDYVSAVIYRLCLNVQETEDLTHDIYVKLYDARQKYDGSVAFTTWLYKIAFNHTLNYLKRKKYTRLKLPFLHRFYNLGEVNSEQNETDKELLATLRKLMDNLKPEFKMCIVLRDVESKSYEEIAGILNISVGTVRSRINRGRKKIVELYKKGGYDQ